MSETDNIVVYDDIAKSAYLINRSDIPARDIIKVAVLDYVPSKNAKTVDLTRATVNGTITNNPVTDTEGYLEIETDYAKPVVNIW